MGPGIEDSSILSATLSNGTAAIDVLWITPSGRVQGESIYNDRLYGFVYGFYDEGVDGVTASTISSLAVQGNETATLLWWITPSGAVLIAVRLANDRIEEWRVSIVAGPESAAKDSEISAVRASKTELRVLWSGPTGEIVVAKAVFSAMTTSKLNWDIRRDFIGDTSRCQVFQTKDSRDDSSQWK